ncbi:hypothetical protein GMDG_08998, partial [Pseudogymnoascus destructans 20631-21]
PKNGFDVTVHADNVADARRWFDALCEGGKVGMAFAETFWSPGYGSLTDRFGVPWMVNTVPGRAGSPAVDEGRPCAGPEPRASSAWTASFRPAAGPTRTSARHGGRDRSPQGLGHGLLGQQEDRVALVIVVGQDDHRHVLVGLLPV